MYFQKWVHHYDQKMKLVRCLNIWQILLQNWGVFLIAIYVLVVDRVQPPKSIFLGIISPDYCPQLPSRNSLRPFFLPSSSYYLVYSLRLRTYALQISIVLWQLQLTFIILLSWCIHLNVPGFYIGFFFLLRLWSRFEKVYINYQHLSDSALTNEAHLPTHSRIAQNKMFIAYKGSRMLANYFIPPFFVN